MEKSLKGRSEDNSEETSSQMKPPFVKITRFFIILAILFLLPVLPGCGAVGPPIAPEDVGIEAKVREQEQSRDPRGQENQGQTEPEEEVELPTFYPIGTR